MRGIINLLYILSYLSAIRNCQRVLSENGRIPRDIRVKVLILFELAIIGSHIREIRVSNNTWVSI
jgi:hypothetical protein